MSEGQDFNSFVMTCARAMGACVMMRDEPFDAPIPTFEPSDYNAKAKLDAEKLLKKLKSMSTEDAMALGKEEKTKDIKRLKECVDREEAENKRLDRMVEEVGEWAPPTEDHQGLKEFMLDQIDISRTAGVYYQGELDKTQSREPTSFIFDKIANAERDIEYHKKGDTEERDRTEERNQWVIALRESLECKEAQK